MAGKACRSLGRIIVVLAAISSVTSQQSAAPAAQTAPSPAPQTAPTPQKSLADIVREQRAKTNGASANPAAPSPTSQPSTQKSLGEIARELATNKRAEVKVTESDSKKLFAEIDEILGFASQDSGLPRRTPVRHQLVGQDDVQRHAANVLADSAETQRIARSEVVLKKFGYLPRDFSLKNYLVTASTQGLGGFYDFKSKTMNLVNWVGLEEQRPIMAHELTHALQDQNYNLMTWQLRPQYVSSMRVSSEDAVESSARRAVVEGQAMIVYFDYLLKPYGRTLGDTPDARDFIRDKMASTYDTALVVRNAPLLLKEVALFPYREGLLFELELLTKGGTEMAFAGAFVRPPVNTHEILEPAAYIQREKTPAVSIADLTPVLAGNYEPYDSGSMGQLDVRILAQQLGCENDMFSIAPEWQGGAYVAVQRKVAGRTPDSPKDSPISTADLALLYVSRWKTPEAAHRFMEIYRKSLVKRVMVSDEKPWLPAGCSSEAECARHNAVRVNTEEGPIFLELLADDTVFIAHSFSEDTANSLRQVVLRRQAGGTKTASADLSLRLLEIPSVQAFQEQVGREILGSPARLQLDKAR